MICKLGQRFFSHQLSLFLLLWRFPHSLLLFEYPFLNLSLLYSRVQKCVFVYRCKFINTFSGCGGKMRGEKLSKQTPLLLLIWPRPITCRSYHWHQQNAGIQVVDRGTRRRERGDKKSTEGVEKGKAKRETMEGGSERGEMRERVFAGQK